MSQFNKNIISENKMIIWVYFGFKCDPLLDQKETNYNSTKFDSQIRQSNLVELVILIEFDQNRISNSTNKIRKTEIRTNSNEFVRAY